MRILVFILSIIFSATVSAEIKSDCNKKSLNNGKRKIHTVNPPERPTEPSFYMLTYDQVSNGNHYAIVLKSKDVIDQLEETITKLHVPDDELLLKEIKHGIPLKDDTDIFKYSIANTRLFHRTEYLVDDLLSKGKGTVIDLYDENTKGKALKEITYVDTEDHGTWREYCVPTGRSILRLVYSIDD